MRTSKALGVTGLAAILLSAAVSLPGISAEASAAPVKTIAKHKDTTIDLSTDRVVIVMEGRDLNTAARPSDLEADFVTKVGLLHDRGIPLTGINVYDWTGESKPLVHAGNSYASWPQLDALVNDDGGALSSEGRAHESLKNMTPAQRLSDTCGVLQDYKARGFNASGMYAYSGGPYIDSYQRSLVSTCYAFGRKYSTGMNTMSKIRYPWALKVLSLNGGCASRAAGCFGGHSPKTYTPSAWLTDHFTPGVGQVAVLQIYHLFQGHGPTWDCDSSRHQTVKTEDYCLSDVTAYLDSLPASVKFVTIDDLAKAVGRGPGQLSSGPSTTSSRG
ncbi:exported hypothetical protein [Nostocoides japonicum T1-X7]|uniref:Uncharacterized protein n=1 Tax=Nostocoides japonicum T1-X7 TaxID=1194083 RepID=A0A077LZ45_9MICO|nr:hypothetical protein [Tetrasphaera japonica]CCH78162.1 exported hypothetical protein [Tetrasphaera japonica T1-X7]